MRFRFLFFCVLWVQIAVGQSGNYFLSHYSPSDERISTLTFAIAQDNKGILYFATRGGVLEFDGHSWNLIATQSPVFTVANWQQEIYVGGLQGFGKIVLGADNTRAYQSLSQQQPQATEIFSSAASTDKIYFANPHAIFVVSAKTNQVESVIQSETELNGLLEITGDVYAKSDQGLLKIADGKLVAPSLAGLNNFSFDFAATKDKSTLIGNSAGQIFLTTTSGLSEIKISDKEYLAHNVAVSAAWLSDSLVAIGTLRGGVLYINPISGETQEFTNFRTGLPDNEVSAMLTDRNQGLWVAHSYGFTRVAPSLPFRSFSHYTGLEGNLLCAKTFQGQTYVGTTLGLFVLTKQDVTEGFFINTSTKPNEAVKKKRDVFSFSKNKSNKTENNLTFKQIIKSSFAYKRVSGVEGKVAQLIEADNQLIAAGNFGVASVSGLKSTSITHIPVRSVFNSASISQLLASTQDDEIKTFAPIKGNWKETQLLDSLNDYVSYIFEDKLENIWLCGRTQATKIETVDGAISSIEKVPFSNPTIDESMGLAYGSEVYMAAGGSFHRYDLKGNVFKKYDSLPSTKKYFASSGYFWFFDGHRWNTVDKRKQAALRLEWLGLFPNIRFIATADKDNLWIITANNELYKFSPSTALQYQNSYPLFLRQVRGQQNRLSPNRSIKISQLESTISFEFIQPDYLSNRAVEYRYRVKGRIDWTNWKTTNNIVNFSYLPTGKYKVEVQTRDLLGKISAADDVTLEVEPPYWRQPWFYLLEILFFGTMVFLVIRLSSGNPKYRFVSQLLSLITIVMIIQLAQVALSAPLAATNSPVVDFFVQVGIALLVLPMEHYLRKFMNRQQKESKPANQ